MKHDDESIGKAVRRALLKKPTVVDQPVERSSAAASPERHLRTKITMNVDSDVVSAFKELGQRVGRPYQALMNDALRSAVSGARSELILKEIKEALLQDQSFLAELIKRKLT